jgi:hypothetical protein
VVVAEREVAEFHHRSLPRSFVRPTPLGAAVHVQTIDALTIVVNAIVAFAMIWGYNTSTLLP